MFELDDVSLKTPLANPKMFRDFLAFEEHSQYSYKKRGKPFPQEWYEFPVYYKGNPHTLIGHDEPLIWPAYTDKLEDDRSFGQEELKRHGVSIIPFQEFTDFDSAIDYVEKNPSAYVIKPSGEAQNIKRLLFVGKEDDGKDVVHVLQSYKAVYADTVKVFQLQKRVRGVEVAVGAFFNGKEFMQPINVNFEHKLLFPGDIGPSTGEMGTCMYWSGPNRIFKATLAKLESRLAEEGYVGYIDVNCMVNGQGIYPLEFTARFGYPTISIQADSLSMPMADSRSRMPPLMFFCGLGRVWRLMRFTPSTTTRPLSGTTRSTRPRLPRSRPARTSTVSFFRIAVSPLAMMSTGPPARARRSS